MSSAEAGAMDELGRARDDLLRGQIAFASNYGGKAPPLLLNAAKRIEPLDRALARETYLDAWGAAYFAGQRWRVGDVREVSAAARSAPQCTSGQRPADLLLHGLGRPGHGRARRGSIRVSRAVSVSPRERSPRQKDCDGDGLRGVAAGAVVGPGALGQRVGPAVAVSSRRRLARPSADLSPALAIFAICVASFQWRPHCR